MKRKQPSLGRTFLGRTEVGRVIACRRGFRFEADWDAPESVPGSREASTRKELAQVLACYGLTVRWAPDAETVRKRREASRARHWRRTGVSEDGIRRLRDGGWL